MTINLQPLQLVIVGNGMATGRLLDELAKQGGHPFAITVIGDEHYGSYNRIMLSPVLAGETDAAAIIQKNHQWYLDNRVRFISGTPATHIDRSRKQVHTEDGHIVDYDHLVVATGSQPAKIPAKHQHLDNIYSFRTLDDVAAISTCATQAQQAVVIGGGLLGLEAAYGLACQGMGVTLVHRSRWLLNRQLDKVAGDYLRGVMEAKGITFCLGAEVDRFIGQQKVTAAKLNNGNVLACDLAIIATGITPNQQLARDANLACGRAVLVDDYMTTSDSNISALGECCEHAGNTFGLVEPIWQQCQTLAAKLCGQTAQAFSNQPVATKLKVSGVQLFSAGEYLTKPEHRELIFIDPRQGIYRKILLTENCIVGIVLFGDTRDGQHYFELMQNKVDVSSIASTLILGRRFYHIESTAQAEPNSTNILELHTALA